MVTEKRLQRNKTTQEFFTPPHIVAEMLEEVPEEFFQNLTPFREVGCGNGNIATQVVERFNGYHELEEILKNIQLVDLMEDNCIDTIKRICGDVKVTTVDIPDGRRAEGLISMFTIDDVLIDWIVQADATKFTWWEKSPKESWLNALGFEFL
jgi:hypothetical protein